VGDKATLRKLSGQ